jgi:hypothetical protein
MNHVGITVAFFIAASAAEPWTPPANPDAQAILSEAEDDHRKGKYDDALAKHVWFHENALRTHPNMYGVRLSFALSDWHDLATKHPPAMEKLLAARDLAARNAVAGTDRRRSFHDMASINRALGEEDLTVETFRTIDEAEPQGATEVLEIAKPALVRAKQFELIGKHLKPKNDFDRMLQRYRQTKEYEKESPIAAASGFADDYFTNEVTTLVAVLVVTKRADEAKEVADLAKREWTDGDFIAALDDALEGNVPPPRP